MNLTRRAWFGTIAALFAAGWTCPLTKAPLTFHGVPLVFDEDIPRGIYAGINRATFPWIGV